MSSFAIKKGVAEMQLKQKRLYERMDSGAIIICALGDGEIVVASARDGCAGAGVVVGAFGEGVDAGAAQHGLATSGLAVESWDASGAFLRHQRPFAHPAIDRVRFVQW